MIRTNINSLRFGLVRHVQHTEHRDTQLLELQQQVEVSFEVGGIQNVYNQIGLFIQDKISGDHFLYGIGREAVGAGQVYYFNCDAVTYHVPDFFLYCDSGIISDVLMLTGDGIEQTGFSGVRVSSEGNTIISVAAFSE
ncbi:hypothetical protein BMS3Bbin04_01269 [bacterium BMS3Bbin04]|nr:hypothetical protein BMS3Bbin04_01269 [bacterium BMS3Bbin04]